MLKKFSNYRDWWKFFVEVFAWTLLTIVSFMLRLDGDLSGYGNEIIQVSTSLLVLKIIVIYLFGTFRQSWRNTGFRDLITLIKSVTTVSFIYFCSAILLRDQITIPLSVPIIEFFLSLLVLGGIRVGTRFFYCLLESS